MKQHTNKPEALQAKFIHRSPILGNQKNEELLAQLVYQIGEGKWSEIARNLKIHGINIEKAQDLYEVWKKINPANVKIKSKQIRDLVQFAIESKGNPNIYISRWYQVHGGVNYQDDYKLISHSYIELKKILIKLIHMFCRKKVSTRRTICLVRQLTIMKFVSIANCTSQTPFIKRLRESSMRFGEMVIKFLDNYMAIRGLQYEMISKVASRSQFEEIAEFIIFFDDLSKIRDKTYKEDDELKSKSKYLASTLKANQESELYRYLYPDLQIVKNYKEAQKTMNSDFVLELETNQLGKNNPTTTHNFVEVQKNKKKTVRGRISYDNKTIFRSVECDKFHQDLLNTVKDDEESDQEIRQQLSINQGKDIQFSPTEEQIESIIISNPSLKQKFDDQVKQLKYQIFIDHQQDQ